MRTSMTEKKPTGSREFCVVGKSERGKRGISLGGEKRERREVRKRQGVRGSIGSSMVKTRHGPVKGSNLFRKGKRTQGI